MDTALTEAQSLLRDAIRSYLHNEVSFDRVRRYEREGGYDRDLWQYLQSAGYLALPFPESLNGDAGELTDLAVLLEELTKRAAMVPLLETMICALAVQRHGDAALAAEIVPAVIAGTMTLSPAILEANDAFDDFSLELVDGRLRGEKRFVDYGQVVTHHLVAANEAGAAGLYLVDANAPEVKATPLPNIARTPKANISYEGVAARKAGGAAALTFLLRAGRALAAIQCLGNAQQALDMTVDYAGMRVQFGRPIGSFQAVKQHVANIATMTLATRFLAYEAVWKLDHGSLSETDLAIAKEWASKTATEVPMMAHQLHGGIGVTEDYDLHFFSRRGKERALSWGTAEECLVTIAGAIEEPVAWR
jgi:3-oxocholest-4-en-26-oyl-CoA dehydrogenase beta subunit